MCVILRGRGRWDNFVPGTFFPGSHVPAAGGLGPAERSCLKASSCRCTAQVIPSGQSLIADYYAAAQRGRAFGGLQLTAALGGMLGSVYATNLGALHMFLENPKRPPASRLSLAYLAAAS